ncbi:cytochrome P450 [Tuber borchii]|uniref:Cytochrome P450 n=1 Tax=Tuber borchii TaxID=42251 RepID=A0A2T6ZZN5_TUBBO|nr:cytochrome P450 [Tuber borchii]
MAIPIFWTTAPGLALGVCLASFVATIIYFTKGTSRGKNFPPGPPTLPILGNMHLVPQERPYLKFTEWAKQYGGIYSIKIAKQTIVLISDVKILKELYDKRGAIYSSRPLPHIGAEIVCPDQTHIIYMPYGETSRNYRAQYHQFMGPGKVEQILPWQSAESTLLLKKIATSPDRYYEHTMRMATAVILESVFGVLPKDYDDPEVTELWTVQREFSEILALTGPPVDHFPFLKWLPDIVSPWRIHARSVRAMHRKLYFRLLNLNKARMEKGERYGTFVEKLIDDKPKHGLSDERIAYVCATLMEAGSDTTASQALDFMMALLAFPDVLKKAQEEVDRVCGTSRLPTLDDRDQMPYIEACVNEVLRWRPPLPYGAPHLLMKDDWYEGYFMPKGTVLFQVQWAMNMDENVYEKPQDFMPERYIRNRFGTKFNAEKDAETGRKEQYGFGLGRKICPGQWFARNTLFVLFAKLVWAFDMKVPTDPKTGKPVPLDTDVRTAFMDGLTTTPFKFPIEFKIRSKAHEEALNTDLVASDKIFAKYGGATV